MGCHSDSFSSTPTAAVLGNSAPAKPLGIVLNAITFSLLLCTEVQPVQPGMQITVDGDTSTNDTCIGLASGAAGNDIIKHSTSEAAQKLEAAVTALLQVSLHKNHLCAYLSNLTAEACMSIVSTGLSLTHSASIRVLHVSTCYRS